MDLVIAYELEPLRDKTEAAYNRTDLFDRRRELMGTWAAYACSTPADVVAIRA